MASSAACGEDECDGQMGVSLFSSFQQQQWIAKSIMRDLLSDAGLLVFSLQGNTSYQTRALGMHN